MTRFFYIVLFVTLGFFLSPTEAYACTTKSTQKEKSCCKVEKSLEKVKSCCDKKKSEKEGCNGNCNNSGCSVSPVFSSILSIYPFEIKEPTLIIQDKKANFSYLEKPITLGFYAIWSPPKIG